MFKDYYDILCISQYASAEEIKKAYRTQSMRWHPDKNPGQDTTAQMQDIVEAYEVLKDEYRRRIYDAEYLKYKAFAQVYKPKESGKKEYRVEDEELEDIIDKAQRSAAEFVRNLKDTFNEAGKGAGNRIVPTLIGIAVFTIISMIVREVHQNTPEASISENDTQFEMEVGNSQNIFSQTQDSLPDRTEDYQTFPEFGFAIKAPIVLEKMPTYGVENAVLGLGGGENGNDPLKATLYQVMIFRFPEEYQDYTIREKTAVKDGIFSEVKTLGQYKEVKVGIYGYDGIEVDYYKNGASNKVLTFVKEDLHFVLLVMSNDNLKSKFDQFTGSLKFFN